MESVYQFEIQATAAEVDGNGHVNNVVYVQWMQDAAIRHAAATGCTAATEAMGATWVARSHQIEYLRPTFDGDIVIVMTWVANLGKVRSLRKYKFIRAADHKILAQGATEWVFVDAKTGRPRTIPDPIHQAFQVVDGDPGVGRS